MKFCQAAWAFQHERFTPRATHVLVSVSGIVQHVCHGHAHMRGPVVYFDRPEPEVRRIW